MSSYSLTSQEQEYIYNQKLNSVNAEHAKLLEQAFERAKVSKLTYSSDSLTYLEIAD